MAPRKMTAAQNRMIHATAARGGLDNEDIHTVVYGLTGKESLTELTVSEAKLVIDRMLAVIGEVDDTPGRASPAQLEYIDSLKQSLGWSAGRLRGFLRSQNGVDDLRFLPRRQVPKLIEALKSMNKRGYRDRKNADEGKEGTV